MRFTFYKYHGTGNDFLIFDDRPGTFPLQSDIIRKLCDRHFGIGADGLMTLSHSDSHNFSMHYYNSDGRESTMCGNGGRCMVAFTNRLGLISENVNFTAVDGVHEAIMLRPDYVKLKMQDVKGIHRIDSDYFIDTGSPHHVRFVKDVRSVNVIADGRAIRNSEEYGQAGTNVNFVQLEGPGYLSLRTYERGVENETLSCGTGTVASAIAAVFAFQPDIYSFNANAPGGKLKVSFRRTGAEEFTDIWLEGPAEFVFEGNIEI
jgi:diaminopimelate epimerase